MVRSPFCAFHPWLTAILVGDMLWDDVPGFFSFGPSLCFLSVHLICFSRDVVVCDVFCEPWLHATPTHLPCAHAARQTPPDSLSRTQLSNAHVRSTGSCMNARVFSCDYSFDKRVNKTFFFGVKIHFCVFFYSRSTTCCCGRRH